MAETSIGEATMAARMADAWKAPDQQEMLSKLDDALNCAKLRADAVLAILDKGDFYALAAAEGNESYALISAAECLLKDLAAQAQAAINANEAAARALRMEANHG